MDHERFDITDITFLTLWPEILHGHHRPMKRF